MPTPAAAQTEGIGVTILSARTNGRGEFHVVHGIAGEIYGMLVAVQHINGNWSTLEISNRVTNDIMWDDQEVRGWIGSTDYDFQEVKIILFHEQPGVYPVREYDVGILTGRTDSQGRYNLPHSYGDRVVGVVAAVRSSSSNIWFTIALSTEDDNRLWWNNYEVAGMIRGESRFQNQDVKALVFYEWDRDYGQGLLKTETVWGQTDQRGVFVLPHDLRPAHEAGTTGFRSNTIHGMIAAVRHDNGNWHVVEQSNTVKNSFWWNDSEVAGQIESGLFADNEARALLFYTSAE